MTSTTQPHAALLILSQPVRVASKEMSAIDTIISITSGQKDADKHAKARAVGGTVSTEISQAQKGAMAAGAKAALHAGGGGGGFSVTQYDAEAASMGFMPIEKSAENAKAYASFLRDMLDDYNGQFSLKKIVSFEEYSTVEKAKLTGKLKGEGLSDEQIEKNNAIAFSKSGYESAMAWRSFENEHALKMADMSVSRLQSAKDRFSEVFGVSVQVKFGEDGRAYAEHFEVQVNGKNLLKWNGDGKFD